MLHLTIKSIKDAVNIPSVKKNKTKTNIAIKEIENWGN